MTLSAAEHIRENLKLLGLSDIDQVVGDCGQAGDRNSLSAMHLSDLCVPIEEIVERLRHSYGEMDYERRMYVRKNGQVVGIVNYRGIFCYLHANELRTYIGWVAATDRGRSELLVGFDLDTVTSNIEKAIRAAFAQKDLFEAYRGDWVEALKRNMSGTARHGWYDGWDMDALWQVATRIVLGQKHQGFAFRLSLSALATK